MAPDRFGDDVDVDEQPTAAADRCVDGWLDRDGDPPRPCPRCRPWLVYGRPPTKAELARPSCDQLAKAADPAPPTTAPGDEPIWRVVVEVPARAENREALFDAVADAAHGWDHDQRDGWDANVYTEEMPASDEVIGQAYLAISADEEYLRAAGRGAGGLYLLPIALRALAARGYLRAIRAEFKETAEDLNSPAENSSLRTWRDGDDEPADVPLVIDRGGRHWHRAVVGRLWRAAEGKTRALLWFELTAAHGPITEACPTCSGPIRETVGMVCQTCGTDYGAAADGER